jgi:hypothetical protein
MRPGTSNRSLSPADLGTPLSCQVLFIHAWFARRPLTAHDELAPCLFYTRRVRSHEWIDARSLALHEAVAAKLEARPQLLDVARANLARWLARDPAGALLEWARLLDQRPLDDILTLLRSSDERAARLRQSSPFAGVLTPEERLAILRQYDARRP